MFLRELTYKFIKKLDIRKLLWFLFIAAAVLLMLFVIGFRIRTDILRRSRTVSELKLDWYYYDESGERVYTTLPNTIELKSGDELLLYNNMVSCYPSGSIICTKAGEFRPTIFRHGNVLYKYDDSLFKKNIQLSRTLYCTAKINNDYGRVPIVIVYHKPDEAGNAAAGYTFNIPSVYIGRESDILVFNCKDYLMSIVLVIAFYLAAVCAFSEWLYWRKLSRSERLLDLAVFLMIFAVWVLTDSGILKYISDKYSGAVVGYISFISFMSFTIPIISFAKHTVKRDEVFFDRLCVPVTANVLIQICLNTVFGVSLISMLPVTHAILLSVSLIVIIKLAVIYSKTHSMDVIKFILALCFMLMSGLISIFWYWKRAVYHQWVFRLGVFIYATYMVYDIYLQLSDYSIMERQLQMDGTRHNDSVSCMPDAYIYLRDLEWIRERHKPEIGQSKNIFHRLFWLKQGADSPKAVDTGYLQINIIISAMGKNDTENEAVSRLKRLAAAAKFVRDTFSENASCYCLDTNMLCVMTSDGDIKINKNILMLMKNVDEYNSRAAEDERLELEVYTDHLMSS